MLHSQARAMQFLRIDFGPAGLVFAVAVLAIVVMRSLERFAHNASARRTRRALQRALGNPTQE